jgi:hypothetical protein
MKRLNVKQKKAIKWLIIIFLGIPLIGILSFVLLVAGISILSPESMEAMMH